MEEYVWVICKYYTIVYKELEHGFWYPYRDMKPIPRISRNELWIQWCIIYSENISIYFLLGNVEDIGFKKIYKDKQACCPYGTCIAALFLLHLAETLNYEPEIYLLHLQGDKGSWLNPLGPTFSWVRDAAFKIFLTY